MITKEEKVRYFYSKGFDPKMIARHVKMSQNVVYGILGLEKPTNKALIKRFSKYKR